MALGVGVFSGGMGNIVVEQAGGFSSVVIKSRSARKAMQKSLAWATEANKENVVLVLSFVLNMNTQPLFCTGDTPFRLQDSPENSSF